jgi:uncharacterized protein (DUF302 family)
MYGYKKETALPFTQAVTRVKEELAREGFGVLSEIDVKATIKKKLNIDFDDYVILGACNPPFAYKALQVTREAGLMMPCNVVVYTQGGKTYIESTLPTLLMNLLNNAALRTTAEQIEAKLKTAVDRA